jgi:hypothetical protein
MTDLNIPISLKFDNELILSNVIKLSNEITYQKYGSGFTDESLTETVRWVTIFNTENHISKIKESLGEDFASLSIVEVLFFVLPPLKQTRVHRDTRDGYSCPEFALNLPLKNSSDVCMSWYLNNVPEKKITTEMTSEEIKYNLRLRGNVSDASCISQIYYTQPYITNIVQWHNVKNNSTENAYFISLRFNLDCTCEQLISNFSPTNGL